MGGLQTMGKRSEKGNNVSVNENESESKSKLAKDKVVGESPYNEFEIQPIEFVLENEDVLHPTDAFVLNNVLKYLCRHRRKNGKEDLEKAIHYIELVKDHTYGND